MNKFKIGDLVTAQSDTYISPPSYIVGLTDSAVVLSRFANTDPTNATSFNLSVWKLELVRTKSEPEVEKVTPETIVVGARYTHKHLPGYVWLGCGKRKPYTVSEFTEKFLVLVTAGSGAGLIFKTEDDEYGCYAGDWNNFELVN